jgi:hypothetical protein
MGTLHPPYFRLLLKVRSGIMEAPGERFTCWTLLGHSESAAGAGGGSAESHSARPDCFPSSRLGTGFAVSEPYQNPTRAYQRIRDLQGLAQKGFIRCRHCAAFRLAQPARSVGRRLAWQLPLLVPPVLSALPSATESRRVKKFMRLAGGNTLEDRRGARCTRLMVPGSSAVPRHGGITERCPCPDDCVRDDNALERRRSVRLSESVTAARGGVEANALGLDAVELPRAACPDWRTHGCGIEYAELCLTEEDRLRPGRSVLENGRKAGRTKGKIQTRFLGQAHPIHFPWPS